MWRAPLRSKFLPISRNLTGARSSKRTFASHIPGVQLHPVPILRPTLWAFAATATIYIGCAAYDVRRDVRDAKRRRLFRDGIVGSYDDFEKAYSSSRFRSRRSSSDDDDDDDESPKWLPMGQIAELFAEHSGAMKFTMGAVALNNVLFLANSFAPGPFMQRFSHIPVSSPNHTMLTSIFVHYGLMHIAVNTWVLFQFAPQVAQSRLFEGNGSHFAAFYLSTGILSSLGEQFATILPTRTYRMNRYARGVGASGVLMASMQPLVLFPLMGHLESRMILPPDTSSLPRSYLSLQ
ncbi:hypothetical protein GGR54DRAFT_593763 [Hypoxylon sp. NC1633]|nr:hypothetical protein GGR54DRAFT_593763 [Hypoxylon sp. NC1633]